MMNKQKFYKKLIHDLIKEQDLNDAIITYGEKQTDDPLSNLPDKYSYHAYLHNKKLHQNENTLIAEVTLGNQLGLISDGWYNSLVSKDCGVLLTKKPYYFNQVFMNAIYGFSQRAGLYHSKEVQKRLKKPLLI